MTPLGPSTSTRKTLKLPHVTALDGVRGLASVTVVFHHALWEVVSPVPVGPVTHVIQQAASFGYLAVDLFFVLSGYLITNLLLLSRRQPHYYRNFYWKRVFRILPAMFLILALSAHLFHFPWIGIFAALLFFADIPITSIPEVGPYWSLSIEEQFYMLWPTILHRTRPRTVFRITLGLIIGAAILRTAFTATGHGRVQYSPLHCDGLAWGALLALLAFRARVPYRSLNRAALWRRHRWILFAGSAAMVFAIFLLHTSVRNLGLPITAAEPLFAGLLLFLITHPRSWPARILASPPFVWLGNISYMVYLSHAYLMVLYDQHLQSLLRPGTEAGLYLRLGIVLAATLLWSTLTLYLFERPIGRLRRYFTLPA
ncbi:MAG: acyltransferase [Acidobacteriota bacterium]